MRSKFQVNATMVANEFIDRYMAVANGEYVKVYLYLLRHDGREIAVGEIADALNHTESDVKRAIAYWVRLGVLEDAEAQGRSEMGDRVVMGRQDGGPMESAAAYQTEVEGNPVLGRSAILTPKGASGNRTGLGGQEMSSGNAQTQMAASNRGYQKPGYQGAGVQTVTQDTIVQNAASTNVAATSAQPQERRHYTPAQVGALADKEEFTQLLYIAQKLMGKVFTPRDCEVFAYLYDSLHMSAELLEYLAEYCAQNDHKSIRYLETVALSWNERGIKTANQARDQAASFNSDCFAVMKAFGLNDRRPGDAEVKIIRRWFQEWAFSKELILEACGRTLKAIQKPSFQYADSILDKWRKAGVRTMEDVKRQDEKREGQKAAKETAAASGYRDNQPQLKPQKNKFHNFEQRNTDYDGMVLERLKQRLGEN